MNRMSASHTPEDTPPVGVPVALHVPWVTDTPTDPLKSVIVEGSLPSPGRKTWNTGPPGTGWIPPGIGEGSPVPGGAADAGQLPEQARAERQPGRARRTAEERPSGEMAMQHRSSGGRQTPGGWAIRGCDREAHGSLLPRGPRRVPIPSRLTSYQAMVRRVREMEKVRRLAR